jgi:hypothetical protein
LASWRRRPPPREIDLGHGPEQAFLVHFEIPLGHAHIAVAKGGASEDQVIAGGFKNAASERFSKSVRAEPAVVLDAGALEGGSDDLAGGLTGDGTGGAVGPVLAGKEEGQVGREVIRTPQVGEAAPQGASEFGR